MNSVSTNKGAQLAQAIAPANLQDQSFMLGLQQQALLEGIQVSFLIATDVSKKAVEQLEK